jgi:hypothetical protein
MNAYKVSTLRTRSAFQFMLPFLLTLFGGLVGLVILCRSGSDKTVTATRSQLWVQEDIAASSNYAVGVGDDDTVAVVNANSCNSKTDVTVNESVAFTKNAAESATNNPLVTRTDLRAGNAVSNADFAISQSASVSGNVIGSDSDHKSASNSSAIPVASSNQDESQQTRSPRVTRHLGFTPEQELYRALYGWGAFESTETAAFQ